MSRMHTARYLIFVFAPAAIFLAAIPWLKTMEDLTVQTVSALVASWTIASSLILSRRQQKRLDEWQLAGAQFSYLWGGLTGSGIIILLLATEPFHGVVSSVSLLFSRTGVAIDMSTLVIILMIGTCLTVLSQALCTLIFQVVWRRQTLGPQE